jgi:DNA-binding NtrC family response regulator
MELIGNVRELHHIVLRALAGHRWSIEGHEEEFDPTPLPTQGCDEANSGPVSFGETLPTPDELIELLLTEADKRYPENRSAAAAAIGLSPQAFANRWKRFQSRAAP